MVPIRYDSQPQEPTNNVAAAVESAQLSSGHNDETLLSAARAESTSSITAALASTTATAAATAASKPKKKYNKSQKEKLKVLSELASEFYNHAQLNTATGYAAACDYNSHIFAELEYTERAPSSLWPTLFSSARVTIL